MKAEDLKPGPELDALVAERVMGWTVGGLDEVFPDMECYYSPIAPDHPLRQVVAWKPSTSIADAWGVVSHLNGAGPRGTWWWRLETQPLHVGLAVILEGSVVISSTAKETMPEAICIAALRAVGAIE